MRVLFHARESYGGPSRHARSRRGGEGRTPARKHRLISRHDLPPSSLPLLKGSIRAPIRSLSRILEPLCVRRESVQRRIAIFSFGVVDSSQFTVDRAQASSNDLSTVNC
jgi:hypothetical protein